MFCHLLRYKRHRYTCRRITNYNLSYPYQKLAFNFINNCIHFLNVIRIEIKHIKLYMYLDLKKNTMVKIKGNIIWTYHRQWSQFHMFVRCIPLGSNKRSHGWRILRLYKKEGFRSVLLKLHNFSFTLLGKIAIFFCFILNLLKLILRVPWHNKNLVDGSTKVFFEIWFYKTETTIDFQ